MRRRRSFVAAALIALVVLTGCNIAARVVVQPDGSGTYSVILTAPKSLGAASSALYSGMQKAAAKSSVPVTVSQVSMGGERGAETTFSFQSLADLKAESDALSSASGGLGIDVTRTRTGWHFTAVPKAATSLGGIAKSTVINVPVSKSPFGNLATLSVVLVLPGRPGESNATGVTHSADTSTFTWESHLDSSTSALQANTSFVGHQASVHLASGLTALHKPGSGSGDGSGPVIIVVAALAVIATVGMLLLLRRRTVSPVGPTPGDEAESGADAIEE